MRPLLTLGTTTGAACHWLEQLRQKLILRERAQLVVRFLFSSSVRLESNRAWSQSHAHRGAGARGVMVTIKLVRPEVLDSPIPPLIPCLFPSSTSILLRLSRQASPVLTVRGV